jgi:phosphoribosyl 1,2-cyclic phosphodiesterase
MSDSPRIDCYSGSTSKSLNAKLGKVWPNLVFIRDSGKECVEFRVQCEILMDVKYADQIQAQVLGPESTDATRKAVLEDLLTHAHPDAQKDFKDIVRAAFAHQPPPPPQSPQQR